MVQDIDDLVHDHNQQVCHNLGGFLPEPRDEQENTFLDSLGTSAFLLGMSDRGQEGQWVWDSDGSPVTWTNWDSIDKGGLTDEPNNAGRDEHCAKMFKQYRPNTDSWNDVKCESTSNIRNGATSLICQRNPGLCTPSVLVLHN